jgi:arginase family enzyme
VRSVHYIDNGNYHYLSKLFLEMMDETFDLLVLDNHSDMQTPAFGDILSCGSWVKNVLDSNANVDNVYLCGVDGEKIDLKQIIKGTNPLYISIDKDVLSKHDYLTNWDQGSLRIDELETFLRDVTAHRNVCGVDVCGGINDFTGQGAASGLDFNIEESNLKTDIRIFEALGCY